MVTLEIGQRFIYTYRNRDRIWQIARAAGRDPYDNHRRFVIVLIEDPGATRGIGEEATVSEVWLQLNGQDIQTTVEPPQGNGCQVAMINHAETLPFRLFATAQECIDYFTENLEPGQEGQWFGWDANLDDDPDMTVTKVDGELVWSD